jgi:septal ring factor EnvC (AmiA/AmiB activator)
MELTTLSREVESLNELLARLPERPKTPNPPKSKMRPGTEQYASAGGSIGAGNFRLGAPTAGKLVSGFGVMLESGRKSFGHIYETRSKAQITTPAQASVLYADALQRDGSFGKVVILEALTGERLVFTGLGGLYIKQGDSVEAGEPIGEMPETDDAAPKLYFEVRNATGFVNPTQWLNRRKAPS